MNPEIKKLKEDRVYFFDAMRSILIIFIILIHILQVFNPNALWLIHNNKDINISPYIIDFLMLFTLESFFIMSGYLAAMHIKKIGLKKFFDSKVKRIIIPILFTAFTLNSIQAYLLNQSGWLDMTLITYLNEGKWISHLWFLINLAIYFLIFYLSVSYFYSTLKKLVNIFDIIFKKYGLYGILFIFSLFVLSFIILFTILSPYIYNKTINIMAILFYFPFFTLGILLFTNKKIFKTFVQVPIIQVFIITAIFVYISSYLSENTNNIYKITYYFFNASSNILASALCFTIFYKFLNKKSKIFSYISNASFTIYLFHHLIVIAIGLLLIYIKIGGYLAFTILFIGVIISTFLIHHFLISKISILSFLYNGKKLKKEK